ncbi:MAG: cytidylate kinase family protein [Patescibacteria group bacterium]
MIITISGLPGAGKTTVAKALAKSLGMQHYSMGDIWGKIAQERGVTVDDLLREAETDPILDRTPDEYQKRLGETEDNFITDGLVSFHFIPQSLKIFLTVDLGTGAERIYHAKKENAHVRADEPEYASVEEARLVVANRIEMNQKRLKRAYGVDFLDKRQYDLVVDTSDQTLEETLGQILGFIKSRQKTNQ